MFHVKHGKTPRRPNDAANHTESKRMIAITEVVLDWMPDAETWTAVARVEGPSGRRVAIVNGDAYSALANVDLSVLKLALIRAAATKAVIELCASRQSWTDAINSAVKRYGLVAEYKAALAEHNPE